MKAEKSKFYFADPEEELGFEEELCRTREGWLVEMKEQDIPQMTVFEAKVEVGGDGFYCLDTFEWSLKGDGTCGKICKAYSPRNGKTGICRNYRQLYETTEKFIVLQLNENQS